MGSAELRRERPSGAADLAAWPFDAPRRLHELQIPALAIERAAANEVAQCADEWIAIPHV